MGVGDESRVQGEGLSASWRLSPKSEPSWRLKPKSEPTSCHSMEDKSKLETKVYS